jgi:hypothetical protein
MSTEPRSRRLPDEVIERLRRLLPPVRDPAVLAAALGERDEHGDDDAPAA